MPHLVTNRPRAANLGESDPDSPSHEVWETFSALTYNLGGLAFIAGSALFLPALEPWKWLGAWLFFAGSLLYLTVTGHDLLEICKFWRLFKADTTAQVVEFTASLSYVSGSILFAVGSLFFLPWWDWTTWGAWSFVIGSALFVLGGCANILMVAEAPTLIYLMLFNITIGSFIVGSALFVVASIPFLWPLHSDFDKQLVFSFTAWEYIVGSALFFFGGLVIFYRKRVRNLLLGPKHHRTSMLVRFVRREISESGRLRPDGSQRE